LLDAVSVAVRERPTATALWYKGRTLSWQELETASDAFAAALVAQGVRPGDRVALLLANCPQFLIAELGIWKAGATVAPLNPIYTEEELVGPLNTSGATVAVVLTPFYERIKTVQPRTKLRRVIAANIKAYFPFLLRTVFTLVAEKRAGHRITLRDGDRDMQALLAEHAGARVTVPRPTPDDIAFLLMSGGTTGSPKAVPARHRDFVMTAAQLEAWTRSALTAWDDKLLLPLPLFHVAGAAVQALALRGHHPLVLVPNPRDIKDLLLTIKKTQPRGIGGVPTLYAAMLEHPLVKDKKVSFASLKISVCGAAPLMAETKRRFEAATGINVIEGYAMTESVCGLCATPLLGTSKEGSVGVPLPDVAVRIVDVDDPYREMPADEVGEILLRSPQMMQGYWQDPAATAEMIIADRDGTRWLRTADLGRVDADGYVFIVDRKKDLMKPNGMQVWPREVEEAIAQHPAVAQVGVRSFPDDRSGEIAVAFVVLRAGMQATADEIRDFCKAHLAPYKVPGRVLFRSDLPKSLIGKVLRRLLTLEESHAVA
jgi:long-chain acyl-CoA synthetase